MPGGIIPDEGLARGLTWTLVNGDTSLVAWQVMVFVNDITPDANTVVADLVEPSWASYARVNIPPAGWSAPVITDHIATCTWGTDPVEFANVSSATQTVYGCALFDPAFNVLRFVQRFDVGDIRPIAAGESVLVVPRFSRGGDLP